MSDYVVTLPAHRLSKRTVQSLKRILAKHPGNEPVILNLVYHGEQRRLSLGVQVEASLDLGVELLGLLDG